MVFLSFAVALSTVGLDLSSFALLGGAVGVGIGFGLQKVVSNLVSGLILLLDRSIKPGDVIEIEVTDPAAPADFRAYCETTGHELLECREDADAFAIVLRKRS